MRLSLRNPRLFVAVIALAIPAIRAVPAFADTYKETFVQSDGRAGPAGIDDAGDFVIAEQFYGESPCGSDPLLCFFTYYVGQSAPVITATMPDLDYDNGTRCNPVLFTGFEAHGGVCNNGHSFVGGDSPVAQDGSFSIGIWAGPDPTTNPIFPGTFDGGDMNANGDVVFDDASEGLVVYFTDLSTVAAEPNTFILIGTGCLSLLGALRRRVSHI